MIQIKNKKDCINNDTYSDKDFIVEKESEKNNNSDKILTRRLEKEKSGPHCNNTNNFRAIYCCTSLTENC